MKVDCHMHTPLCGHADGVPDDYVRAAAVAGIGLITFTCHIPMSVDGFGGDRIRMPIDQLPRYRDLIRSAARLGESIGVEVLCGIEAEIFPESTAMETMDAVLSANPFDFVLGSLHHQLPVYRQWLSDQGVRGDAEIVRCYFNHLTEGVASGRYHSIAHPDVIRIYGTVQSFDPADHEPEIRRFLSAAVENDVCIEVNTSGLTKGVYQVHPDPVIIGWAVEQGVKFTMGSDAHRPAGVGQHFEPVTKLLRERGCHGVYFHRLGRCESAPFD